MKSQTGGDCIYGVDLKEQELTLMASRKEDFLTPSNLSAACSCLSRTGDSRIKTFYYFLYRIAFECTKYVQENQIDIYILFCLLLHK